MPSASGLPGFESISVLSGVDRELKDEVSEPSEVVGDRSGSESMRRFAYLSSGTLAEDAIAISGTFDVDESGSWWLERRLVFEFPGVAAEVSIARS